LRRMALGAVLAVLTIVILTPSGSAQPEETIETLTTTLPWTWSSGAAVWTGQHIFLIGGFRNGPLTDAIVRFDPISGTVEDEPVRLPGPRAYAPAVWTGTEILVFGGVSSSGNWDQTVRYNPTTREMRFGANLTSSRGNMPAVWTGQHAYIFGGAAGFDIIRHDILRYDPVADRMDVMAAAMPGFPKDHAATWADGRAYLFGSVYDFIILVYDPAADTIGNPGASSVIPQATTRSTVQIGPYTYLFGGWDGGFVDQIVRFHTGTMAWGYVSGNLTRAQGWTAAALAGDRAYIFGGWNGATHSNAIQVFRSTESILTSPLGLALIATPIVAAVAVAAFLLRRRGRAAAPREEKPPETPPESRT